MVVRPTRLLLPVLIGALVACTGQPEEAPRGEPDPSTSIPAAEGPELGAFHELLPDPAAEGLPLLTGPPEGVASGEPLVLWRWDGTDWPTVSADGEAPPARNFFSAAYDDRRDVVLLYGGDDGRGQILNDTWAWDGQTWPGCRTGPRARPVSPGRW